MRVVHIVPMLLFLRLAGCPAFAQSMVENAPVEAREYIEKAKFDATIYRGPTALKYPFNFKGTYYAYGKEFVKSSVEYNKKWYYGVDLNLDASRDELCLSMPGSGIVIVLSKELVGSFVMDGKEYVNFKGGIKGLKDGYYQVMRIARGTVYKKIEKRHNKVDGVTEEFYPVVKYYLVKDGVAKRFRKARRMGL